jgi:nucleoside-diphosphate-sugar epimerase
MTAPEPLTGKRILVTGVTGQVAGPLSRNLVAAGNTVYGTSRFADPAAREKVAADGVVPVAIDLETQDLDEIPDDLDYVLHMAVSKDQDFDRALAANAEGVAHLIEKVAGVRAFLHCSSCAVYEPNGHVAHKETDPLGDNHRAMGFLPTYSISKIAAESSAKYAAKRFGVPTVIARLDVPYGPTHGWMSFQLQMAQHGMKIGVSADRPNTHCLLHDDDLLSSLPYLLAAADVPATIYNWCNPEIVSIEEWCDELHRLTGVDFELEETTATIPPNPVDSSKLLGLGWQPEVSWRDGIRRLVETTYPDLLKV